MTWSERPFDDPGIDRKRSPRTGATLIRLEERKTKRPPSCPSLSCPKNSPRVRPIAASSFLSVLTVGELFPFSICDSAPAVMPAFPASARTERPRLVRCCRIRTPSSRSSCFLGDMVASVYNFIRAFSIIRLASQRREAPGILLRVLCVLGVVTAVSPSITFHIFSGGEAQKAVVPCRDEDDDVCDARPARAAGRR